MKIYTRRGDAGETDLFGGVRVDKNALRVEAYGAVDELNAHVGQCAAATDCDDLRLLLVGIQPALFDLGAYLATPAEVGPARSAAAATPAAEVEALERHIDTLEAELEPLKRFVLPGGTAASAALHVARTVCRRAERRVVALHRAEPLADTALRFVNRLSDLLFVMARVANRRAGTGDIEWRGRGR